MKTASECMCVMRVVSCGEWMPVKRNDTSLNCSVAQLSSAQLGCSTTKRNAKTEATEPSRSIDHSPNATSFSSTAPKHNLNNHKNLFHTYSFDHSHARDETTDTAPITRADQSSMTLQCLCKVWHQAITHEQQTSAATHLDTSTLITRHMPPIQCSSTHRN